MSLIANPSHAEAKPPRTDYGSLTVDPLTPVIGGEVKGIDLSQPLSNQQLDAIHQAFTDRSVLVFRDQHLDREAHKRFARHFGPLHVHPLNRGGREDDPEILVVKTTKNSKFTAGDGWHTDVTCDEKPPLGSMLYITRTPEIGGGDTLFCSTYAAYEALSPTMQAFLEPLVAVHDGARPYQGNYNYAPVDGQAHPKTEHPVIGVHPHSGRKILYVNAGFTTRIKGLTASESEAVLQMLFRHMANGVRFQCRVRWEPNTLVFWDNRCTQHHAAWDYYPHTRYGERVSIVGEPPAAVAA